ncbi:sodium/hydrogen exchanger 10-like isoform X2 [Paramacrobiotus metropolitanus]|nr:sodium/hydrogen exchanger 10-like isoform X2 [Paramacrobiotus metropolitanus]XP_055336167.1 sodium/hydrogen exchanger 10-like isoform X2 [Paramacrobiotus metropolitanus]
MIIIIGIIISVASHHCSPPYVELLVSSFALSGNLIMLLFFPITLFYSAYRLPLHSLRLLWKHVAVLSIVGKSLAIAITTLSSTLILARDQHSTWGLLTGFLFASIVSATDSLETSEIAKTDCDHRTSVLMEASALFGNGCTFTWYTFVIAAFRSYSSQSFSPVLFTETILLGLLVAPAFGFACGVLQMVFLMHIYNSWQSEVLILLSTPFVVAWIAYYLFGSCAMLSVITLGLWTNYKSDAISINIKPVAVQFLVTFSYIFNVFIFLLVGYLLAETAYTVADDLPSDWWKTVYRHLALHAFTVWSTIGALTILRPILMRMDDANSIYDLRNVFLITWTTPRGATAMVLLHHVMDTEKGMLLGNRRDTEVDLEISVIVVIALSQFIQCSTMRKLLIFLGSFSEHSESQVVITARKGFFNSLERIRQEEIRTMRQNSRFSDVNWQIVANHTSLKESGKASTQKNPKNTGSLRILTAQIACINCQKACVLPQEILKMQDTGVSKLSKALKMSFYKQYEGGMLTRVSLKVLCDLIDEVTIHRKELSGTHIRHYLYSHMSFGFRKRLSDARHPTSHESSMVPPQNSSRRAAFEMVQTSEFENVVLCSVFFHVVLTIAGWIITANNDLSSVAQVVTIVMLMLNFGFAVIYTTECVLKWYGCGTKQYYGTSWITWNRFDFALLLLTYADLIMNVVTLSQPMESGTRIVLNPAAVRALRLARIFRTSRVLRLLKPLSPYLLRLIEISITHHLYEAYMVAHGYIVAQEDVGRLLDQLISFQPLVIGFRLKCRKSSEDIAHEIGLLNQQHSDIATAVKTRQAIMAVWNTIGQTIVMLKRQGVIEEDDYEKFESELDAKMKKLGKLPHRIPLRDPEQRLRNLPWSLGDEKICNVLKMIYEKQTVEMGSTFLHENDVPKGIYIIANGLVQLKTSKVFLDHHTLGEIYSTDNIKRQYTGTSEFGSDVKIEYALPGNGLNEQALLIGFNRRLNAIAETAVDLLFIPSENLFLAFQMVPELERKLWKHIAVTIVTNIEVQMKNLVSDNIDSEIEQARLSRGDVRLVKPGRIVADLDMYADTYLLAGSVMELQGRNQHFAPAKLPHSVQDIQIKSGREPIRDSDGDVIYPGYAVLFIVPHDGSVMETSTVHESQLGLAKTSDVSSRISSLSMPRQHRHRESVLDKLRDAVPRGTIVHLLTTGFHRLAGGPAETVYEEHQTDDDELKAARERAHAIKHLRTGSVGQNQATATAMQVAMGTEQQKVKVKATGYQRLSAVGETHGRHNLHPGMHSKPVDDHSHWVKNEESVEVVHEQRHRLRMHWWHQ